MRIIGMDRNEEAVAWAREQMNLEGPAGPCATYSMVNDDNSFRAVFVLSDINGHSACMHFAAEPGKRWLTPAFVNGVMALAFFVLNVKRITGPIRENNTQSRAVAEKYGFTLEGIMRKAFPDGENCCIYSFLKEEFAAHRWFAKK